MELFLVLLFLAVGLGKSQEGPICPPEGTYYYPDPQSCAHYYVCTYGQLFHLSCALGTHWNQALGICDLPENVDCGATEGPSTPVTEYPTTTPVTTQATSELTNPHTQLPSTTSRPEDFYCPLEVEFIYMPHPDVCRLFYWCEYGVYGGGSNCGTGLWFSYSYQACVNPYDSECATEPRPSTVPW